MKHNLKWLREQPFTSTIDVDLVIEELEQQKINYSVLAEPSRSRCLELIDEVLGTTK